MGSVSWKVAERAAKFVEEVVVRYKDRRHLAMWNAWDEPRCKPIGESFGSRTSHAKSGRFVV